MIFCLMLYYKFYFKVDRFKAPDFVLIYVIIGIKQN